MKIELKKVKVCKFASEETTCFEAEIWIDGKKSGYVSNDGKGGCDHFTPPQLGIDLNAFAKATLGEQSFECGGKSYQYTANADTLIGGLLDQHLDQKDLARSLKSKMLYRHKSKEGVFEISLKKIGGDLERAISIAIQKGWLESRDFVLNLMPQEKALAFYRGELK